MQEGRHSIASPQKVKKGIAANTKNMELVFEKLCELSSYGLFNIKSDEVRTNYTDDEIEALKGAVEELREEQFLEEIYG